MMACVLQEMLGMLETKDVRCITVTLLNYSEGFSLTLPGNNCKDSTTHKFQYSDAPDFLQCLCFGLLPPFCIPIFELCPCQLFYKGCILAKIIDKRTIDAECPSSSSTASTPPLIVGSEKRLSGYENPVEYALLRPSQETILADAKQLVQNNHLSKKMFMELESKLCKLISPFVESQLDEPKSCLFDVSRFSIGYLQRKRKRIDEELARDFKVSRLMQNKTTWRKTTRQNNGVASQPQWHWLNEQSSQTGAKYLSHYCERLPNVQDPQFLANISSAATGQMMTMMPSVSQDVVAEYLIELLADHAKNPARVQPITRLRVLKKGTNFWGEIYMDTDANLVCVSSFDLGMLPFEAKQYVSQYLDMITEGGRRAAKISRFISGGTDGQVLTSAELQDIGFRFSDWDTDMVKMQQGCFPDYYGGNKI